jgi:hypothetical protein
MGRSYWFECSKCGYRAKVSGRADRGLNLFVQTVICRDCKELYDAVIRLRLPLEPWPEPVARDRPVAGPKLLCKTGTPNFQSVANRLLYMGVTQYDWRTFPLECPVSSKHRVESWNAPDKCPRCGIYLEKNVLPYRIWD